MSLPVHKITEVYNEATCYNTDSEKGVNSDKKIRDVVQSHYVDNIFICLWNIRELSSW